MSWVGRRLDHLGSAAFGGAGGIGFSQAPAFVHAYLQRLGGHIDEARLTIEKIENGRILPWLDDAARSEASAELAARLGQLEQLRQSLLDAPPVLRPALLMRQGDWSIARRAAEDFVPAVPIDPASLTWTAIGIVAAVVVYEIVKVPAWAVRRRRARAAGPAGSANAGGTRSRT